MFLPLDSVGEAIMFSGCPFIRPDRCCYHNISWTALAVSIKLTVTIHKPLLMTWLDSGGQRSRSQPAVEAPTLMLGRWSPIF